MTPEIELADVEARTIAAIKARLAMADIPDKIFPLMDRVWTFIRGNGIESFGHNIWLYGPPADGQVDVEIGVQVVAPFRSEDGVVCSHTPFGKAAHAVHFGDYSELPRVHMAVTSWCRERGHVLAGRSWEVYGDWEEDTAKRRTDVFHLLG